MARLLFLAAIFVIFEYGTSFEIVSKDAWSIVAPTGRPKWLATPVPKVFIHHTVTSTCNTWSACVRILRAIQHGHMSDRNWTDIGYNFLMDSNGIVYEGRGWNTEGVHTQSQNPKGIGISFIGNYMDTEPTYSQKNSLNELLRFGVRNRYIKENYLLNGHRDFWATACPGDRLYAYIQTLPNFNYKW